MKIDTEVIATILINLLENAWERSFPREGKGKASLERECVSATERIGLMRDYVTCLKFTTKPRLR